MRRWGYSVVLCMALVGCASTNTVPIVKHEVVYIKPPAEFRKPCGYIDFSIARDDYLSLSAVDKEQYLFSLVKQSLYNTKECNLMIDSLNEWIRKTENGSRE